MVITGTYDPYLVALSILVAGFASYAALDLVGRVAPAQGPTHRIWLAAAALIMGGGIWSMHFVAMLAFVLPMPMSYDVGLTVLSLILAILATSGGFYVISRTGVSRHRLILSGVFMGVAISGLAGKLIAEEMAGTAERFDVFSKVEHQTFPGGTMLRHPLLVLAMLWYVLRDKLP